MFSIAAQVRYHSLQSSDDRVDHFDRRIASSDEQRQLADRADGFVLTGVGERGNGRGVQSGDALQDFPLLLDTKVEDPKATLVLRKKSGDRRDGQSAR